MKGLERLLMLISILMILIGYGINKFSSKYLTMYRSMQFRNLKVSEMINNSLGTQPLMIMIGLISILGLAYFVVKRRGEIKENALAILGTLVCSGQALKALSNHENGEMGVYVLLLGYSTGLIAFMVCLFRKEKV